MSFIVVNGDNDPPPPLPPPPKMPLPPLLRGPLTVCERGLVDWDELGRLPFFALLYYDKVFVYGFVDIFIFLTIF